MTEAEYWEEYDEIKRNLEKKMQKLRKQVK